MMTTIFVYEHASALGASRLHKFRLAPSILREGRAMLAAVSEDLRAIPGVRVRGLLAPCESAFRKLTARADWSLIIAPESDGILEQRCRWVVESGGRLLGPTPDAIHLTADKLALARHFREKHVPTPRTWALGSEPEHLRPVVWKPCDGAGSQATFLINSRTDRVNAEIELLKESSEALMLAQEFTVGRPVSVAFLLGSRERVALRASSQIISRDGRFRYLGGITPLPPLLEQRAITLARMAIDSVSGLRGYVGVDLVLGLHAGEDRVIEINPRLTTSYLGLRRKAKVNLADIYLRMMYGYPVAAILWNDEIITFGVADA